MDLIRSSDYELTAYTTTALLKNNEFALNYWGATILLPAPTQPLFTTYIIHYSVLKLFHSMPEITIYTVQSKGEAVYLRQLPK